MRIEWTTMGAQRCRLGAAALWLVAAAGLELRL